jgi:hypothetical protein
LLCCISCKKGFQKYKTLNSDNNNYFNFVLNFQPIYQDFMHSKIIIYLLVLLLGLNTSCSKRQKLIGSKENQVYIQKSDGKWTLYRNNKPYYIKGVHGTGNLKTLNEIGGNSIIAYHSEVNDSLLNIAHSLNISVSIILDIKKVRFDYDYTDDKVIIPQRDWIKKFVLRYKDHPAILFWIIGNEAHLMKRDNIALWKEINQQSKLIHSIDPNHLTTTTIASYPTKTYDPTQLRVYAPDLDFISLNIYEFAHRVKRERQNLLWGIDGPYLVTEWGGDPYWILDKTEWGAVIEPSSSSFEKTQQIIQNHKVIIEKDSNYCIGGYAFYFGEKQERTHTTFSMLLHGKLKTQALESLEYCWTDTIISNYCPRIKEAKIDISSLPEALYLPADSTFNFLIYAEEPDLEPMSMTWEILREGEYFRKFGGESEKYPERMSKCDSILNYQKSFSFKTPDEEGAFRIFIYVYDTSGNAASVNVPFYTLK